MGIIDEITHYLRQDNYSGNTLPKECMNIINDESLQNIKFINPLIYLKMRKGLVDEIPGAVGEFGRSIRNPIPVNGPFGEVLYLSKLATDNANSSILSHRLCSIGKVDIYETVSLDGGVWDIMHFSYYYHRRSRKSPKGYFIENNNNSIIAGTNRRVKEFPYGISEAVKNFTMSTLNRPILSSDIKNAFNDKEFRRDPIHKLKINYLSKLNTARAPYDSEITIYNDACDICGGDITSRIDYQYMRDKIDAELKNISKEYIVKCPYCLQSIRSDSVECPLCSMYLPSELIKSISEKDTEIKHDTYSCILCNNELPLDFDVPLGT